MPSSSEIAEVIRLLGLTNDHGATSGIVTAIEREVHRRLDHLADDPSGYADLHGHRMQCALRMAGIAADLSGDPDTWWNGPGLEITSKAGDLLNFEPTEEALERFTAARSR